MDRVLFWKGKRRPHDIVYCLSKMRGDEPGMETSNPCRYKTNAYSLHVDTVDCNSHLPVSYPSGSLRLHAGALQILGSGSRAKKPNRTAKVQARGSQVQDATCGRALYYCSVTLIKAQECQSGMVA